MNRAARQAALEAVNIYNDPRSAATRRESWYVQLDEGRKLVVIGFRTPDWHWLANNGFDPEEFDGGARPEETSEVRYDGPECCRCVGAGKLWRHVEWKGISDTIPRLQRDYAHLLVEGKPVDFTEVDCGVCKGHGHKAQVYRLPEPRLAAGAEDRKYIPFRYVAVPVCMVNCDVCRGRGRHVNPAIDAGGLTAEDFDDADFCEGYRSGVYDVTCAGCRGKGKVPEVDVTSLLPEDRALWDDHARWLDELECERRAYEREVSAEMRWGC